LPHARKIERGLRDRRAKKCGAARAGDPRRRGRKRVDLAESGLSRAIAVSVPDQHHLLADRRSRHGAPGGSVATAEHA
jgi:hypothetical protein